MITVEEQNALTSIPKIYRLGDRHTVGILEGNIVIEEKIDGSQFSFGVKDGVLVCRSKNQEINLADPKMFRLAVEAVQKMLLCDGYVYQCEFVQKPRHNVLTYARVPVGNLVLFDVRTPVGDYLTPFQKLACARALGVEPVREFFAGEWSPSLDLGTFLAQESQLGGCKVEGVVIKNYGRPHDEREGHPQTAKVVSEAFKEVKTTQCTHVGGNAEQKDRVGQVVAPYRTEARWLKAVQHLREAGKLTDSPKDIGPLLAETWTDIMAEEGTTIKDKLFAAFARELRSGLTQGFPDWYLAKLEHGFNVFEETVVNAPAV